MRIVCGVILIILVLALMPGCSDQSGAFAGTGADMQGGTLSFTLTWPEEDMASRTIPSATRRIVVTAKRQLTVLKEITITRAAGQTTATGTMTGLTPGPVMLYARAFDTNNILLTSGASSVTVVSGSNVSAQITLSQVGNGGDPNNPVNAIDGAAMRRVSAITFTMGSSDGTSYYDEKPTHQVTLNTYYIYKYEVTVAQYRAFCAATGRALPPTPSWGWHDDHPIVNVSWHDAAAYASWAGCRLPTEAEWEYAAKGADNRRYPWGMSWDVSLCANGNNSTGTSPVSSYSSGVSPAGAYNMAGNAFEWCSDWYVEDYYSSSPSNNPTGPGTGTNKVLRGGSWDDRGDSFRCTFRWFLPPGIQWPQVGFRCVKQ